MPISTDDFNSCMDLMCKTFNCQHDPDVEAVYWNSVKEWSVPLWRDAVQHFLTNHKYHNLPLPAELEEYRRLRRKDQPDPGGPTKGSLLGLLKPEAIARFFDCLNRRWDDKTVEFYAGEGDFILKSDWDAFRRRNEGTELAYLIEKPVDF